ncbi:MAG: DNA mismatch repair protein MutL [Legionellaceae bacterium]
MLKVSTNRIYLLDHRLANQIAAGEVIERPASVVKELIENSLDAGAKRIDIKIEKGGLQLIRICDDGIGIYQEDLPLALSRHATSKVSSLHDLAQLKSLGFRGEALASICSISRFILTSRPLSQEIGWRIKVEDKIREPLLTPAAHPIGTTVEVADLFFNTPARRKFIRSEQVEWHSILELVKRIALSRFDVHFSLKHQNKNIFQLRKAEDETGRLRRLHEICGHSFITNSIGLETSVGDLKLHGWLGLPEKAPTQPSPQYCYINGRMIRDKLLLHAIKQAYESLLPIGRHPVYVLYLEINPATIDVNVHPTKHEVRFQESRFVHDFVLSAIKRALSNNERLYPMPIQENNTIPTYENKAFHLSIAEEKSIYNASTPHKETILAPENIMRALGIPLGQLHNRYLLLQCEQGLGIIDFHKAYEGLMYQSLTNIVENEKEILAQPLLFPLVTKNSEFQKVILKHQNLLKLCGIDISLFGEEQIIIRTLPRLFQNTQAKEIGQNWFELLKQNKKEITMDVVLKNLAQAYSFVKQKLDTQEINELLKDLHKNNEILKQCFIELSLHDINAFFPPFKNN